jgi:hypothetical protein
MASKQKFPHYRLEEATEGLPVAMQSTGRYQVVKPAQADTFPTRVDALLAAGGAAVEAVRVER